MGTSRCRSLLLGLFIAVSSGTHANAPDSSFVDSVLAIPYNDMVRDLSASHAMLQRAMARAHGDGRKDAYGKIHRSLSTVTLLSGQLDSSVYHAQQAIHHFREQDDKLMLGVTLCDLGHVTRRRDTDQALVYYREGIGILEDLDAKLELTRGYNNLSMVYEVMGVMDSALYFGRKGLVLVEQLRDSTGLPYSLNRVAFYLLHDKEFEEAQRLMLRADSIRRATRDEHGMAEQLLYFGDLYQAWSKVPEAIARFNEAIQAARTAQVPYMEQYAQERLAELYDVQGDHLNALVATRRAFAIKDSLFNESNSKTIFELEQRYQVAEKDRSIAELGAEAARRQLYIWISLIALVLVVVSGLLFYQVKQRRLRAERDAAIIAERDAGLKAVFDATENERRRLAAELHDGIGQQLGGLKHRLESIKSGNGMAAPLDEVIHIVDDTSREVRDLAHQMMPKALSRVGLVPALEEMLQRSFHGTGVLCAFDHFGVDADLRPELATGLYRIAQELVGNILKHAQATQVDVQLLRNKEHLVLLVQDNGKGYTPGTSPGIGLRNITDRARSLGGTFTISGAAQQGTEASVRVPIQAPVPA
jgi:signal transduction histidine kinase